MITISFKSFNFKLNPRRFPHRFLRRAPRLCRPQRHQCRCRPRPGGGAAGRSQHVHVCTEKIQGAARMSEPAGQHQLHQNDSFANVGANRHLGSMVSIM